MAEWYGGRRAVLEVLNSEQPVRKAVIAQGVPPAEIQAIFSLLKEKRIPYQFVPRRALDGMVPGVHQGVAVQVHSAAPQELRDFLSGLEIASRTYVCLLDEIQDPHNLGAIARSALCFGCSALIFPKRRSAPVNAAAMKASSGALARLPLVQISNLQVAIERLKEKGFWIVGADADSPNRLGQAPFQFPLALVLGSEGRGLKPVLRNACDQLFSIPQTGPVASLNVSNAAAIFFYEIAKR